MMRYTLKSSRLAGISDVTFLARATVETTHSTLICRGNLDFFPLTTLTLSLFISHFPATPLPSAIHNPGSP